MKKLYFFIISMFLLSFLQNPKLLCHENLEEKKCFSWFFGSGDDSGTGDPCSAKVDTSGLICSEEKDHLLFRKEFVQSAVKGFAGIEQDSESKIPKIAFCCSGGGYRAMVSSLGFMLGAEHIGLIDATEYISVLSGSSWMLCNYLMRKKLQNITLQEYREILEKRVQVDFWDRETLDLEPFVGKILNVLSERKKVEPADLWGAILSDRLWGDISGAQDINFSTIRDLFSEDLFNWPFPLCNLSITDLFPYEWMEVNPFVVGSDYLGGYIPTDMFDSAFKRGKCLEGFDEKCLGWYLGMFGSAYNLSFGDMIILLAKEREEDWFLKLVLNMIDQANIYEKRFLSSPVYNFSWEMNSSPLKKQKLVDVSDAGIAFNLPFPPIFKNGRGADVVVVCDASANVGYKNYPELHYAKAYMKRKGLKFPPLDNPKKIADHLAIFEDENDKTVPTVIYFSNPIKVSTVQFIYEKELFDSVCDSMKDLVVTNSSAIVDVIRDKAL